MRDRLSQTRCKGLTKAGQPCRAAAMEGGLCFFHANPNKAKELGRIGGLKSYRIAKDANDALDLNSAAGIRDSVPQLIEDVRSGTLQAGKAAAVASLLNLQLRAIANSYTEKTLADLDKRLTEMEKMNLEREVQEAKENEHGHATWRPGPM
ncbi:MAG TPA: DUF5763 domain-containing protein [Terriglobales bacterium]|nr:DUF5763 domain-containing protein [Terriglobales bacterium]